MKSMAKCALSWCVGLMTVTTAMFVPHEAEARSPMPVRCIPIQPGQSMGPIRLGMTVPQLKALKLGFAYTSPRYRTVAKVGNYRVVFDVKKGKRTVRIVQRQITKKVRCIQLGKKRIDTTRSTQSIASQLGQCLPIEMRRGGNVIQCHNYGLLLSYNGYRGGWRSLSIQKIKPISMPMPRCSNYLVPGSHIATPNKDWKTSKTKSVRIKIKPNVTYCVRNTQLSTHTGMSAIPNIFYGECSQHKVKNGWVVHCNHTRIQFFFGTDKKLVGWQMARYNRKPQPSSFESFIKNNPSNGTVPTKSEKANISLQ